MLPFGIFQAVVAIEVGGTHGSGVLIGTNSNTYLATARHAVAGFADDVRFFPPNTSHGVRTIPASRFEYLADVAVARIDGREIVNGFFEIGMDKIVAYQDLYLVGYPLGYRIRTPVLDVKYTLPFAKKAIHSNNSDGDKFYVDTSVNDGFSGGGCFFKDGHGTWRLAGIISGRCRDIEGFSVVYRADLVSEIIEKLQVRT